MNAILRPELDLDPAYERRGWKGGRDFFPRPADKTSDVGDYEWRQRMDEVRTRQWRSLDPMTVGDWCCDDRLVDAIKSRDETRIGMTVMDIINEGIERIARSEA